MKRCITISFFVIAFIFFGCSDPLNREFNQTPKDKISPENAFTDESGLEIYTNNFYRNLPTGNDIVRSDDESPFMVRREVPTYLVPGAYDSKEAGGWSWGWLRTINFFIQNAPEQAKANDVPSDAIDNYLGITKFFRAWFYAHKVKRFGDVPWYSKPLDPADSVELNKTQDPREVVMDSVLNDLDFAIDHIDDSKNDDASVITKWVALAYKSRIALFEGTWRKYHDETGLGDSADEWLRESRDAAEKLMESGEYSLHENSDEPEMSYRELFTQENSAPPTDETLLAYNGSDELNTFHDANWHFTSPTQGIHLGLDKMMVNTYLNRDGSRFTDENGYQTQTFMEEGKNRDLRLQQTIRMGDYKRDGEPAPPDFSATDAGYQSIKLTVDNTDFDGDKSNPNSLPIMRYAEVLLNYAEAQAELGELTDDGWMKTIGALRERAGIEETSRPNTADSYLQDNFYPDISDPDLLEIRREREIELSFEGFGYDDVRRWKRGELLTKSYKGMYVPEMNSGMDLNEDGNPDVSFVENTPSDKTSGVVYVEVGGSTKLSEGDHGNILWREDDEKEWDDHKYLYPIPFDELTLNPDLEQNPGWAQ